MAGSRPRSLTPPMLDALLDHLLEKPDQYLDEMAVFLLDEFEARVTKSTISRALRSAHSNGQSNHVGGSNSWICEISLPTIGRSNLWTCEIISLCLKAKMELLMVVEGGLLVAVAVD